MKKILLTLVVVVKENEVLLGLKKRGFGVNRWNGFGGKVEAGESIEEAARREFFEETGTTVDLIEEFGVIEFSFADSNDILEVHIFRGDKISGEPKETEEMRPRWFKIENIPYDNMWSDDKYWLPSFLSGHKFAGKFTFNNPKDIVIISHEFKEKE